MEGERLEYGLGEVCDFLNEYARSHPGCSKKDVAATTGQRFGLTRKRSVYAGPQFSVRFSTAGGSSFSNVVISLSTLRNYDHLPFVVCVVRPTGTELLLANTTFLKKVSHSSHKLRVDNVRGSILGHDIIRSYDDISNSPENFDTLFACHQEFTWAENLARLVEATNAIAPTGERFQPSKEQEATILKSPEFAASVLKDSEYLGLIAELEQIVREKHDSILQASAIDNVNLRGNQIEQIITAGGNVHDLHDLRVRLSSGAVIEIDVKSKILGLASNPKCYNVDKMLSVLAAGNVVFCLLFVGVNRDTQAISTRLISIFDKTILAATRTQFHWAGRNSRGVTQLTGDFSSVLDERYRQQIDIAEAVHFLKSLLVIKPGQED